MKTLQFKTNIKCGGCVAKVSPHLNKTVGENKWKVDTLDPEKTLTVETDLDECIIVADLKEAGFVAQRM